MDNLRGIVRIASTDIIGTKLLFDGLRKIKGVNFMFSNAICNNLNFDHKKQIGTLNDEDVKRIEHLIKNPETLPKWMLNRRHDYETGKDMHVTGADLNLNKDLDIKRLKKIKSYKGMRHSIGQPVRGQRTRSHFRSGTSVGVQRKTAAAAKPAEKEKKGKGK